MPRAVRPAPATLLVLLPCLLLAGCLPAGPLSAAPAPPERGAAAPAAPEPEDAPTPAREGVIGEGLASWYGPNFAGQVTANGEVFDPAQLTAAHKTLPFGTRVRVTHLGSGEAVVVRINDRGPFKGARIIDLSRAAASRIGLRSEGVAPVRLEYAGSEGGPRRLVAAESLRGYDVLAPGVPPGRLLVLRSEDAADVVVRVVEGTPPSDAALRGSELFAAPALVQRLGPVVDVEGR